MKLKVDPARLQVFHEARKRRLYVGELSYHKEKDQYEFIYDKRYLSLKNAIPIGPELSLFKKKHTTKATRFFPSLQDRIPSKSNPAYEDYCQAQGISPNEKNPIVLLGFIGRRGPSSFVFEPVYQNEFSSLDILKFRKQLDLARHDLAEAFDFSLPTLQRIEAGKSTDPNTIKRLQIYFEFPDVALWQLQQTGSRVHADIQDRLVDFFTGKLGVKSRSPDNSDGPKKF